MPIQFPPVNPGDPVPEDGDTYLYLINQQEYICRRQDPSIPAQWAATGLISTTSFGYRGTVEIRSTAPTDAVKGNIYSVIDGGVADVSFDGLSGTEVTQYSLIIFDDPEWLLVNTESGSIVSSPWIRTSQGDIQPAIQTDNLDMRQGNIHINTFPEI